MKKRHFGLITLIGASVLTLTACGAKLKNEASYSSSSSSSNTTTATSSTSNTTTTSSSNTTGSSTSSSSTNSSAASSSNSKASSATSTSTASSASTTDTQTDLSGFQITLATAGVGAFTQSGSIYTITAAGEYNLSGELADGVVYVNAGEDDEVILNLNGVTISSTTNSPICILSAGDVDISAKKGTVNTITDNRTSIDTTDETQGSGAIYSECDLKIKGTGTLNVYGTVNNGIHTNDDLKIQKATLYVYALNNALKGNDSVEIVSGNVTAISTGGDGIKTTNAGVNSTTSKQKGIVTITGTAVVDIYACCDGIDAAYDTVICADDAGDEPTVNVKTSSYSSYSGEVASSLATTLYMKISSSYYSSNYDYYVYCTNSATSASEWVKLEYYTSTSSGGSFGGSSRTYYYLKGDIDNLATNYTSLAFYMVTSGSTPSTSSYYAASSTETINTSKDMYSISSISSGKINGSWSNYSSSSSTSMGPGGMQDQGNTDKTEYSTKGIKAGNEITISGGVIDIDAYDDGLHTSYGDTLDTDLGTYGTGNITISGGTINITSKDDGIHAEQTLLISGGSVTIETAYEGLESPQINITNGEVDVYGTDDGLNAGTSSYFSSAINVSGGYVYVLVASGDTDAIDANGTYTQTGGVVVSRNLASSGTATALDTDGTAKITGGTFIGFGNMETTPSVSNVSKTTVSASYTSGTYTLNLTSNGVTTSVVSFDLTTSYSSMYFAGASGSYTLMKGTSSFKTFSL